MEEQSFPGQLPQSSPPSPPPIYQSPVQQYKRKPSHRTALTIAIVIASLCALVLMAWVLTKGQPWALLGHSREVTSENAERELPFRIRRTGRRGAAWIVTNPNDKQLVVEWVNFNGEYAPPLARRYYLAEGSVLADLEAKLPVTLSIGESVVFVENDWSGRGYGKTVIYIDFQTSAGKFRYRP